MNNMRFSVFAGTLIVSVVFGIPATVATAHRGVPHYSAYWHHHFGTGGIRSWRPYRYGTTVNRIQARRPFVRAHPAVAPARQAATARGAGGGLATFYDPAPAGRGFTAAHLSLPMGTHILVTNLANRRSVVVRIADRGPAAWTGRILDLSRTAATSLGMIQAGVVPISYRIVN